VIDAVNDVLSGSSKRSTEPPPPQS
jgi:hypothetical protein